MRYAVALFGEAERGNFHSLLPFTSLAGFADALGAPPPDTQGISLGIQALLFHKKVVYIRVKEEGFSQDDYFKGLYLIEQEPFKNELAAVCLPGVGDPEILGPFHHTCSTSGLFLITTASDFYDYMTSLKDLS